MKLLKWLSALFVAYLMVLGFSTKTVVEATTVGNLKRERSSYVGRMEFRHPQGTQNTWEDYMIFKINGEAVFCLDPATYAYEGRYVGEEFRDVEQITARVRVDKAIQLKLAYITYFGYQVNPTHKNYHYTQALIWETIGYAARSFNGGLSLSEYRSWKANVMAKVNGHKEFASFTGQTHTLTVGQSITLTDTNNVVQNLTIPTTQNGYTFKRNGNQLTITATKDAKDGNVQFTQPRDNRIHGTSILYKKPGSQTVASFKLRDPQYADVTLKAIKNANIQVTKTSSTTGKVMADVEFTLYDATTNKAIQTAKTDKNGVAQFTNLEAGRKFYMKETRTQKGYMLNETRYDYTAVAGETKRFNVKNEPVPTMTSTATNASGGKTAFWQDAQKETVTIKDVVPNQTYKLVSFAMVNAGKTKWKEQTITFTPKATTHSHTFTYTGVSKGFTGNIVYGAKLYKGNKLIAEHYDWNNKNQTVTVIKPAMTSVATSDKGQKQAYAHQAHKETINVTGLVPNQNYKLVSFANLPQWQTKWKEQTINFTPKTSTHQHTFTYTGVANHFTGDVVYGANLYLGNTLLSEHFDWKNKNQTVTVVKPSMTSVATSDKGEKQAYAHQAHKETVNVTGLIPNQQYKLVSFAMTQYGKWKEQTINFTPKTNTHQHTFTYTGVANHFTGSVVYGAKLYLGNTLLSEHYDWNNKNQTVTVVKPSMTSVATSDKGEKQAYAHQAHKETVNVTGLIPNQQYKLVSFAMVNAGKTKWKEQTINFTPKTNTHQHTFTYTGVNATFTGNVVYGAKLYLGNTLLSEHFDWNNKNQTVTVIKPTIVTVATTENGQKTGYRDEKHLEKATITNVLPNRTYTLVAKQYTSSGRLLTSQTRQITPKTSTHTENFTFTVPNGVAGNIVYAQELLLDGKQVANHFDLKNKSQTVFVDEPHIETIATTTQGRKVGYSHEDHKEEAELTGLIVGRTYRLVATQYDKTGKAYATQTRTFKADKKERVETFTFSVPTGFTGHLVYGQVLYDEDSQVAVHYDLNNTLQTVTVVDPSMTSNATSLTGEKTVFAYDKHQEVVDVAGLIPNQAYKLVSFQMNAQTKQKMSEQVITFTPTSPVYSHTFNYTVPQDFSGDVVYGATLYVGNELIDEHFDWHNKKQTVTVVKPTITTKATTVSGAKLGYAYEDHKEVAVMTDLIPNGEYEVVATQYDKTGKVYASQTATFTATESTYTHEFTFSVPKGFKGHLVYGETLSYKGQVIATHYDLENKEQTVEIITPDITTKATTQSGDKVGYTFEDHIEVAELTGLIIGRQYEVVATQYDETGKAYAKQSREFIADTTERTEEFTFTVPKGFTGTIVYGEDLYTDGKKIAVHFDLKSIPQSVKVVEPSITTKATTVSGAKLGYAYEDHKEVAVMTDLIPNREYEVVATQYDKTGKVYASQTATFTATESTYTHEFIFSVPKGFKGHLVYGETLSYKGQVIATHYDLENKEQTVEIITPDITTKATTQSGDKVGYTFEDHIEVAELTGLIIGRKYEVVATQYDETGKAYAKQSREFIADTTERTEEFTFTVPKGFTGTIVYGEDLYTDGKKIAVHFDLKSIPQSVKVVEPSITTKATTVSGAKLGYAYEDHKEVAVMTDLIPNREYEVVATQYDKTGKVYASQTATFTATESTYTHEFIFSVPKGFKGHLVYGETLSYKGQVIATHYDLENKEQTVEIITPDITTKATTQSGDKVGYTFEDHIEVAELTGLIIGRKYEVVATQYDETGKVYAKQSREFIADTTERTEEFTFTVPKGFTGTIVYGEDLYTDGKKVAVHFDLKSIPQSVKVVEPSITTKATTVSGGKVGYDYEDHKEVAVLTNLIPNREYEVVATQYDKTGKVYASQTATFTAKENTYTHEFTFSVPKGFKGHLVYGETLSYKGQVIATHYDLENKEQTVEIITPDITTKATTQSGDKVGYTFEDHIEVAELTGLIIGRKYEVVATQYDETGKVYAKQSREFIADTTERTEEFTFTVPKGFTGTIVYGEDLYTDGKKVAVHFDLKSIPQSVKVVDPAISTVAKVGGKTTMVKGHNVTVTDTLTYSNFKNAEVAIKTWVVKYGTNEKVSEVYTRIVTLNGNGEVTVTLDGFDTSKLPAGKYTLMEQVFEVKNGKVTDKLIAEHVDNKDEKQTFTVIAKPELPKTGSVDNTAFFVIGTLLIALSGVLVGVKGRQDN